MFTHEEAGVFLQDIFKKVFEPGDVAVLPEFYHQDAIGHFNQRLITYSDIKERVKLLSTFGRKRFEVQQHYVFDQFIFFECAQSWLVPGHDDLCEANVSGVYRIQDTKVAEVWLMVHGSQQPYQQINQHFEQNMKAFSIQKSSKQQFFKYLSDFEYFYQKRKVSLSGQEQEILFYYLRGHTSKEIGKEMGLSHRTVETYIANVLNKYGVSNKAELRQVLAF